MTVTLPHIRWWRPGHVQVLSLVVAWAVLLILPGLAADISYVYDDTGRLRAVIDPASDTAIYTYL